MVSLSGKRPSRSAVAIASMEVVSDAKDKIIMRRVEDGHESAKEEDELAAAAFHLAADRPHPGCTVELVFLGDSDIKPVSMTPKVLGNAKPPSRQWRPRSGKVASRSRKPSPALAARCSLFAAGCPPERSRKKSLPDLPVTSACCD